MDSVLKGKDLAESLVNKGFSVEQLLCFYDKYASDGRIKGMTTTNEVVKEIIIEETWERCCSYMESDFMMDLGGGRPARRLVSHAWKSRFVNTCLNIILDATEWPREELFRPLKDERGKVIQERDETGKKRPVGEFYHKGMLKADRLLRVLEPDILEKTYWLCCFAVDEHRAICGDCWTCNAKPEWNQDPVMHLKANPCLLCAKPKFNPCQCGAIKYRSGDELYEIDKFPEVVARMECVVVSLDPDMDTIRRVWVVAEIGQAIQVTTAHFRLALGLSAAPMLKLSHGEELMETVENCQSTSDDDRNRILGDIKKMEGGIQAYDLFINCMLELQFGRASRLQLLPQSVKTSLKFLHNLYMDFHWNEKMQMFTDELMGTHDSFVALKSLQGIGVSCRGLEQMMSTKGLGERLCQLQELSKLEVDFTGCCSITSLASFEKIAQLKALASVNLKFIGCSDLGSVQELGQGLSGLPLLSSLDLSFNGCKRLVSLDELGHGLTNLRALSRLNIDCKECSALRHTDFSGLAGCKDLTSLTLIFSGCKHLASIDDLGKGLRGLQALTSLELVFEDCTSLRSAGLMGLNGCKALASCKLNFSGCSSLVALDQLGEGLSALKALVSLDINFSQCEVLASIDEMCKGLACLELLTTLKIDLSMCRKLASIDGLGKALAGLEATTTELAVDFEPGKSGANWSIDGRVQSVTPKGPAELAGVQIGMKMIQVNDRNFQALFEVFTDLAFVDGDEFYQNKPYRIVFGKMEWSPKGAHLKALQSLVLNFTGCEKLTTIDEFGKGLAGLQARNIVAEIKGTVKFEEASLPASEKASGKALTTLDLNFCSCKALISIDELGKGLGNLHALTSMNLDCTCCGHLTSVDELGKGLAGLHALSVLALDFSECGNLQSIDGLSKGLKVLRALTSLRMYFFECVSLRSVGLAGLAGCQALTSLDLGFFKCEGLTSIDELSIGLMEVHELTSLSLGFCYCRSLASIGELLKALAGLQGLNQRHSLFFEAKPSLNSKSSQPARNGRFRVDFQHCDALPLSLRENFQNRQDLLKEYADADENAPEEMVGHLWKRSPSALMSWKYQQRYFRVRGGKIRWWHSQDDFSKWGQSKGCVDLTVNSIEVIPESAGTKFKIKPKKKERKESAGWKNLVDDDPDSPRSPSKAKNESRWRLFSDASETTTFSQTSPRSFASSGKERRWVQGNFTGSKDGRQFYLDATDSEHSREDWIRSIREHEAYGRTIRDAEQEMASEIATSHARKTVAMRTCGTCHSTFRSFHNTAHKAKKSVVSWAETVDKRRRPPALAAVATQDSVEEKSQPSSTRSTTSEPRMTVQGNFAW